MSDGTNQQSAAIEQALLALEHAKQDSADFQRINTDQVDAAIAALQAAMEPRPTPPTRLPVSQWPEPASTYRGENYIGYNRNDLIRYAGHVLDLHGISATTEDPSKTNPTEKSHDSE